MKQVKSTAISVFALALALMWLAPLVWLVGTAFSEPTFHMTFLPNSRFTFGNLSYVWNAIPFARYYLNTLILVVVTFCVQFVTSTLAAYALAVMDFKGQTLVFAVIFMQIIIPNDVLITPNFMTLADLGLTDTKVGIMLPFFGSALAIFLLRQHFKSIPKALAEAARIDGGNAFQLFRHITLPSLRPLIFLTLIFRTIDSLKIYDMPFVLTQGGPGNSTEFLSLHIYRLANAQNGLIGRAAANAIILMVISTMVSKILIHYQRKGD